MEERLAGGALGCGAAGMQSPRPGTGWGVVVVEPLSQADDTVAGRGGGQGRRKPCSFGEEVREGFSVEGEAAAQRGRAGWRPLAQPLPRSWGRSPMDEQEVPPWRKAARWVRETGLGWRRGV